MLLASDRLVAAYYEIDYGGGESGGGMGDVVVIRDSHEKPVERLPENGPRGPELELPLDPVRPEKPKDKIKLPMIIPIKLPDVPLPPLDPLKKPNKPLPN